MGTQLLERLLALLRESEQGGGGREDGRAGTGAGGLVPSDSACLGPLGPGVGERQEGPEVSPQAWEVIPEPQGEVLGRGVPPRSPCQLPSSQHWSRQSH